MKGKDIQEELKAIVDELPLSPRGKLASIHLQSRRMLTSRVENLSEVEYKVLPHNYRNHYAWLQANRPDEAIAFWNKWAYDPRPKPSDPFELEKKALAKLRQEVKPLRRRI